MLDRILGGIDYGAGKLTDAIGGIGSGISGAANYTGIGQPISRGVDSLMGGLTSGAGYLVNMPARGIEGIASGAQKAGGGIQSLVSQLGGSISDAFQDTPARSIQQNRFTPDQMQALQQILGQGMQMQQQAAQPIDFAPLAQQQRQRFQTETMPQLMQQYTNTMGEGGRDQGMRNITAQAASQMEGDLYGQAVKHQLDQRAQQANMAQNMMTLGLQPQFDTLYEPEKMSGGKAFLGEVGPTAMAALADYMGAGGSASAILSLLRKQTKKQKEKSSKKSNEGG